jgi:hypothetical protein
MKKFNDDILKPDEYNLIKKKKKAKKHGKKKKR